MKKIIKVIILGLGLAYLFYLLKDKIIQDNPEPGKYLHSKSGKVYEVLGTGIQTETKEKLVIYKNENDMLFARPKKNFNETITLNGEKIKRFEKIEEDNLPNY